MKLMISEQLEEAILVKEIEMKNKVATVQESLHKFATTIQPEDSEKITHFDTM